MKMPSKIKKKWLKALRSGEYGQTKGILTDGKGSFCCLGVLQHVVSGGKCEADESGYNSEPSLGWYKKAGIVVDCTKSSFGDGAYKDDMHERKLIDMNDGGYNYFGGKVVRSRRFSAIANWIEKNIETTD